MPDLALGRLPVKSVQELDAFVKKLVHHETKAIGGVRRSQIVYVADDADQAGDFAALADASIAMQPVGIDVQRIYYDPSATDRAVPWREPNAQKAWQRTRSALSAGADIVNYSGHGYY